MRISELSSIIAVNDDSVLVVDHATEGTKKIKISDLKGYVLASADTTLDDYILKSSIVNNLNSVAIDAPLSAAQGKDLKTSINDIYTRMNGLKCYYETGTVTIADGSSSPKATTIKLAKGFVEDIDEIMGVIVKLNQYQLPYMHPTQGNTIIHSIVYNSDGTVSIIISNSTLAWTNSKYRITVFYRYTSDGEMGSDV